MTAEVIITGPHLLRKYNEYRALGYVVAWRGNGRICMVPGGVPMKFEPIVEVDA